FSTRRRHTSSSRDWSSDIASALYGTLAECAANTDHGSRARRREIEEPPAGTPAPTAPAGAGSVANPARCTGKFSGKAAELSADSRPRRKRRTYPPGIHVVRQQN